MKLYVAMVGLPARGKSTLAKRIRSGLEQQGIRTAIFNNGELRRTLFGLESGSAELKITTSDILKLTKEPLPTSET